METSSGLELFFLPPLGTRLQRRGQSRGTAEADGLRLRLMAYQECRAAGAGELRGRWLSSTPKLWLTLEGKDP